VLILSLRQAQYSAYELFDTLTLLSSGYMVYHGPAGDIALQYFKNLGVCMCMYIRACKHVCVQCVHVWLCALFCSVSYAFNICSFTYSAR